MVGRQRLCTCGGCPLMGIHLHMETWDVDSLQGANLLVTSKGRIKLADFGASRKIEELASCGEYDTKACSLQRSQALVRVWADLPVEYIEKCHSGLTAAFRTV